MSTEPDLRYHPCGMTDAEHDHAVCERRWAAEELERIQTHGPCPYHDYGLLFNCTCPHTDAPE